MIGLLKKIVRKLQHLRQRFVGFIKRIIRFFVSFMVKRISAYPRLVDLAKRFLNKFPYIKVLVRRILKPRFHTIDLAAADIPLTQYAQQLEDDLQRAMAQKIGR